MGINPITGQSDRAVAEREGQRFDDETAEDRERPRITPKAGPPLSAGARVGPKQMEQEEGAMFMPASSMAKAPPPYYAIGHRSNRQICSIA